MSLDPCAALPAGQLCAKRLTRRSARFSTLNVRTDTSNGTKSIFTLMEPSLYLGSEPWHGGLVPIHPRLSKR
ncbi:hypothetical protein V1277_002830 [Bradyrhizobium sp. AZCC 1588]